MAFCYDCGRECVEGGAPAPVCPEHGPRWKLIRNAPCADVLVERDGRVLLGRRAIEPGRGLWEIPGGFLDLGEHPDDGARREAREELGVDVTLTGFLGTYVDRWGPDWVQVNVYLAETDGEPAPADGEVLVVAWFAPEDLPAEEQMVPGHHRRVRDWASRQSRDRPSD